MKNIIFAKTNMADAAILNFDKLLQFANRLSKHYQIWDVDRSHEVLSVWIMTNLIFAKTNMADAAILNFDKMLQFANSLINHYQIWGVDRSHEVLLE